MVASCCLEKQWMAAPVGQVAVPRTTASLVVAVVVAEAAEEALGEGRVATYLESVLAAEAALVMRSTGRAVAMVLQNCLEAVAAGAWELTE
tara:strand:- start:1181 stop:1453 length:273 start_codon:yes stop_codon:yes gene_type:complete